jgi:hypothetical protein
VWTAASLGSSLLNALLQRKFTFRRHSPATLLYRAFGASGSLVGLAVYAGLQEVDPRHPVVVGTLAQALALAIPLVLNLLSVRERVGQMAHGGCVGLEELARRLGADNAWWSQPTPDPLDPERRRVAPSGLEELIRHCAESTTADLVIQSPSGRPQPRRNIESRSAIIVPKPHTGCVAVLVRRSVRPLTHADLEQAVRLLDVPAGEMDAHLSLRVANP